MGADQARFGHEPGDALLRAAVVEPTQLGVDPWRAIGRPGAPMDLTDQGGELSISDAVGRWWAPRPRVIART